MKLIIVFWGLISHFQLPGIERAVLVSEPHHQSSMSIKVSDLKDPAQIKGFAGGRIIKDYDGTEWGVWDLKGTHLKFQKLPSGATNVDPAIPSLKEITDGSNPLTHILDGTLHRHINAYVDYTGGDLIAANAYACPVAWTPPRPPGQGTLPTATFKSGLATPAVGYIGDISAADPPYILNGTDRLDLLPNATVFIGNLTDGSHPGPHHKEYLWLLDDASYICEIKGACPYAPSLNAPIFGSASMLSARVASVQVPLDFHILDLGNPECSDTRFP